MGKTSILSMICAVFLGSQAGAATTAKYAAPLSQNPTVSGGTYTTGGGITVAADLREYKGRTLVCGVWALSRQQSVLTVNMERRVLAKGSVFLGRERVLYGFLFMPRIDPAADYGGAPARCVLTARPWQPGDAARRPVIRIPRLLLTKETGDDGEPGGPTVYFKQTGPGAGVN